MPKGSRFSKPLSNDQKASFPVVPGVLECLNEMADFRGITRAELLRRIVCASIVADSPTKLGTLSGIKQAQIEHLAALAPDIV